VDAWTHHCVKLWAMSAVMILMVMLNSCGRDQKEEQKGAAPVTTGVASISGTITVDPALKEKAGKSPLLMIIASTSPEPTKPAIIVQRTADATFPYQYKLTAEDITLVGSRFEGNMYVSARIDPEGKIGPAGPGTLDGTYPRNPVPVGSSKVDIVISKSY
jgi:hypothetical protein